MIVILNSFEVDADKGLNFAEYDFKVDQEAVKKYEDWLNQNKEDEEDINLEEADNGHYYLRTGTYSVEVISESGSDEQEWVVE